MHSMEEEGEVGLGREPNDTHNGKGQWKKRVGWDLGGSPTTLIMEKDNGRVCFPSIIQVSFSRNYSEGKNCGIFLNLAFC